MAQFQKGHTYAPLGTVDYADLNELVDDATALKGIITEQNPMPEALATNDQIIIANTSMSSALQKANISALVTLLSGVTNVDFNATPASVFNDSVTDPDGDVVISLSLAPQQGNKVLAAPADGTSAVPAFRALVPADIAVAGPVAVPANNVIDWTLGNLFTKDLINGAGNTAFTFTNLANGQTIRVRLIQNSTAGHQTASWSATSHTMIWRDGGGAPVVTALNGARDIFVFTKIGTLIYGYADQDFRV